MAEDKIGSLSVDIEAPIGKVESNVKSAEKILEGLAAKTYSIKIDDSRLSTLLDLISRTEKALTGTGKTTKAREVTLKVKTIIDGKDVISQIQTALDSHKFTIHVEGIVEGVTSHGTHTVNVVGGVGGGGGAQPSAGRPGASKDLEQIFNNKKAKDLRDTVDRLYMGLGLVGKELDGATRPVDRMVELAHRFGTNWDEFNKSLGSIPEFKTDPTLKSSLAALGKIGGRAGVFQTIRGDIGSGGSGQQTQQAAHAAIAIVNQPQVRQAVASQPVAGQALAEARKRTDDEIRRAIRSAPKTDILAGIEPFMRTTAGKGGSPKRGPARAIGEAENARREAEHLSRLAQLEKERDSREVTDEQRHQRTLKGIEPEHERLTKMANAKMEEALALADVAPAGPTGRGPRGGTGRGVPVAGSVSGQTTRRGRGITGPQPGSDAEADLRANQQLGDTNRANVRRLRSTTPEVPFAGGIGAKIDLEPLLRFAERGGFRGLVEEVGGKNKGQLHQLSPTGDTTGELLESEASIRDVGRRRKQFSLPNVPGLGQVKSVQPTEAFARAVAEMSGADRTSVDDLLARPEIANQVRQAIGAGGRNKPMFGSSKNGQFYSPETSAVGGGSSIARAAREDLAADIDHITPGERRILDKNSRIEGAANRKRIEEGHGLSTLEINQRLSENPVLLGARQRELFGGADRQGTFTPGSAHPNLAQAAYDEFNKRIADPKAFQAAGFAPGATEAGGSRGSAMHAIYEQIVTELSEGFGDDQEVKKLGKTLLGDLGATIFGENRTKATFAEEDIASREKPIRGSLRTPKTNGPESSIALDRFSTRGTRASVAREAAIRQGLRPTTDLDVERQGLEGRVAGLAMPFDAQIAALEAKRQGQQLEAPVSGRAAGPYLPGTPPPTGLVNPGVITAQQIADVRAQRDAATKTERERLAQIARTQTAAQKAAMGLGEQFPGDINAQRAGIGGVRAPRGVSQAPFAAELTQLLQTREGSKGFQPGGLPTALGNQPGAQLSGDKTRKIYGKQGIVIGDGAVVPPFGGAGAGAAVGGPGGSGPWHVIIDGPFPLEVAGTGGGGGGGRRGRGTGAPPPDDEEPGIVGAGKPAKELRQKPINARSVGTGNPTGAQVFTFEPDEEGDRRDEARREKRRDELFTARTKPGRPEPLPKLTAAEEAAITPPRAARGGLPLLGSAYAQAQADRTARILSPANPEVLRGQVLAAQAQQKLQSRSLGTSIVSLAENIFGGRQPALLRVAQLRDAGRRQSGLEGQLEAQNQDLETAQSGRVATARQITGNRRLGVPVSPDLLEAHAKYRQQVRDITVAIGNTHAALKHVNTDFAALEKNAVGASDVLRNLGAGFVGGVGGGLVTSAVSGVAQTIVSGLQQTLGPIVERASGFQNVAGQKTGAIADLIRQSGGNVQGAVAGALGATNISAAGAGLISQPIADRAATEAGNKALAEQIDLLHTAQSVQRQNKGLAGVDKGIIATTGGLFGSNLGGVASTQELLTNELQAAGPTNTPGLLNQVSGGSATPGITDVGGSFIKDPIGFLTTMNKIRDSSGDLATVLDQNASDSDQALGFFNDQAEKGGSKLKLVAQSADDVGKAQVKQSVALAKSAGLFELANKLQATNTSISGAQNPQDIVNFLASINRGSQTPTPELFIQEQMRSIKAQVQVEDAQRQRRLDVQIPSEFGIGQAEHPFGNQAAGVEPLLKALGRKPDAQLAGLQTDIKQQTDQGAGQAVGQVIGSLGLGAGMDFAKALGEASKYGQQISQLQIGVETEQAALAAHQYAAQLIVADRSLADAKGLVGSITDDTKNLGSIQREQFMLQRQGESLSLGMTQRQINFQKALAAFQAPGETSAERSARIKEAQLEADYAQKQLNIRKQLFGLGGAEFKITASRGLQDALRNVTLLKEGFAVSVDTAVANKKIAALTILQEKSNKKVEAYYNAAVNRTNDIIALEGQLVAQTGKDLVQVANDVIGAYVKVYNGMIAAIGGGGGSGTEASGTAVPHAQGMVGITNGITNLGQAGIAGEAGGEALIVLKRPHAGGVGGQGGGNVFVSIIFQGNVSMRSDDDIKKLSAQVQQEMNRHLANIGARIAA